MELDFLQDEPKLVLTYPHKSKFNMIGCLSIISSFFNCYIDTEASY